MTLSARSLSNSQKDTEHMQVQSIEDKITRFLEKKFRTSRSFSTKNTYKSALKKFIKFLRIQYNLDIQQVLRKTEAKEADPVEILDNYYSFHLFHYQNSL